MSDNTVLNSGSGGDTIATDDIGGVKYQRTKLSLGADGTAVDAGAGAGAVGTDTQRVTLGSDDPAVTLLTGLSKAEDAAHSSGDKGIQLLTVRKDTAAATSGTDGDYQPLVTDSSGRVYVNVGAGGIAGVTEDAVASGSAEGILAIASRKDTLATLTPADGDYVATKVNARGAQWVALDTTVAPLVVGNVAHDAADSGAPVKVGAKAIAALSGTTLVAAADRTDAQSDLDGVIITRDGYALGDVVSGNASNTDGTSTSLIAASGSGIKTYLTDVTITNMSATAIYVELKDGSTAKYTLPVPAGGGVTHSFKTPLAGTANTAWNFDPSAAATTVYCSATGFKSKI